MALDLAARLVRVGPAREVIAVVERCHRALERQDLKSMSREVQFANDLRTQETHDVREDRELESGIDLLGDRGAADQRTPLEDERLLAGLREIRGSDEAVVAAADDDG